MSGRTDSAGSGCSLVGTIPMNCLAPGSTTNWFRMRIGRGIELEEGRLGSGFTDAVNRHAHQSPVEPQVEQLLAVVTPTRLNAAARRDAAARAWLVETLNVYFPRPGLVGGVGQPSTIGRQLWIYGIEASGGE